MGHNRQQPRLLMRVTETFERLSSPLVVLLIAPVHIPVNGLVVFDWMFGKMIGRLVCFITNTRKLQLADLEFFYDAINLMTFCS
jgi:hypothetical protein